LADYQGESRRLASYQNVNFPTEFGKKRKQAIDFLIKNELKGYFLFSFGS